MLNRKKKREIIRHPIILLGSKTEKGKLKASSENKGLLIMLMKTLKTIITGTIQINSLKIKSMRRTTPNS
jgi:hypothetical protein